MDLYAKNEKAVRELHEQIVKDIRLVLKMRGYLTGKVSHNYSFEILPDRLLVNERHTDRIGVDELLDILRDAHHVIPKLLAGVRGNGGPKTK